MKLWQFARAAGYLCVGLVGLAASNVIAADVGTGCESVLVHGKNTSSVEMSRSTFDKAIESYCNEATSSKGSASSLGASASYKLISAAYSKSKLSTEETYQSYCASKDQEAHRNEAYKSYGLSIDPKAFASYNACLAMQNAGASVTILSNTEDTFSLQVTHLAGKGTKPVRFQIPSQLLKEPANCAWEPTGDEANPAAKPQIELNVNYSRVLSCNRTTGKKPIAIALTSIDYVSTPFTFLWEGSEEDQSSKISELHKRIKRLEENELPQNAILAVSSNEKCPERWKPYDKAYGRFLRGIDLSGSKVDADGKREAGTLQGDAFQGHKHRSDGNWFMTDDNAPPNGRVTPGGAVGSRHFGYVGLIASDPAFGEARVASETRPKNVAVLYCARE